MLSKLFFTCNAVLPIVLTILTGYVLKQLKLFPENFFTLLNKLGFRCCLPTMLFYNVYNINNLSDVTHYGSICILCFCGVMIPFILTAIGSGLFMKDKRQKGVMTQASYRSNNAIIGISLVISLVNGEAQAVAVASVITSIFIPLFNILAVISLCMFMGDEYKSSDRMESFKNQAKSIINKICTNPLIIGVALGFLVLIIRSLLPVTVNENGSEVPVFTIKNNLPFIFKTIQMIGSCATTIALIALGGTFTFSAVARLKWQIIIGTALRILIVPVTTLFIAFKLGFGRMEFPALIALLATPVAVSSVPMATEMDNDAELAGQLVVWTSIFSAFTLFGIIFVCAQAGIFQA